MASLITRIGLGLVALALLTLASCGSPAFEDFEPAPERGTSFLRLQQLPAQPVVGLVPAAPVLDPVPAVPVLEQVSSSVFSRLGFVDPLASKWYTDVD